MVASKLKLDTGRGKPFRFILNHSHATAANVYLMLYPKPALAKQLRLSPALLRAVWYALTQISTDDLIGEGRVRIEIGLVRRKQV